MDSPDRHSADPADWLPRLEELAYDAGRPLAVVATVTRLPDGWTGPGRRDRQRSVRAADADRPESPACIQHTRNRGRKVTVLRLARSELKRMTGGLLPKLTILALTMVPLLYGAVYLYANWDPYGNLNQIDAALVVEDTGATSADGTRLEAGRKVADSLVDGHVFNWQPVAGTAEADQGVSSGKYAFALKIPRDFSANLVSPGSFDAASQAMLNVTTNDANNYLLSTIVDKLTTAVHTTVAKEVGEETANQLLTGFGTIHSQMLKAADGAGQLADGVASLHDGTVTLHQGTGELKTGAAELYSGQLKLRDGANTLSAGAGQLSSGLPAQGQDRHAARRLPEARRRRRAGGRRKRRAQHQGPGHRRTSWPPRSRPPRRPSASRVVASNSRLVAAGVLTPGAGRQGPGRLRRHRRVPPASPRPPPSCRPTPPRSSSWPTAPPPSAPGPPSSPAPHPPSATPSRRPPPARTSSPPAPPPSPPASRAPSTAPPNSSEGAQKLDDGAAQLESGAATAADGAGTLAANSPRAPARSPTPTTPRRTASSKVMADPVAVSNVSQAKAGSYGAGLAPFFLTLALWIGVFMLVQAMRPVTQRALASNAPAWKIAVGGWLPFLAVSAVQASLLTLVVDVGLGLNPAHPGADVVLHAGRGHGVQRDHPGRGGAAGLARQARGAHPAGAAAGVLRRHLPVADHARSRCMWCTRSCPWATWSPACGT